MAELQAVGDRAESQILRRYISASMQQLHNAEGELGKAAKHVVTKREEVAA